MLWIFPDVISDNDASVVHLNLLSISENFESNAYLRAEDPVFLSPDSEPDSIQASFHGFNIVEH